jgi:S-adenosylmethionine decarboxylase
MELIHKTTYKNKVVPAEVYNFQEWISVTDPDVLKDAFSTLLDHSGYHVLNYMEHLFPNGGFTSLWLLAESHLAIHTFIEEQKTYIELSGCNMEMNKKFRKAFLLKFENQIVKHTINQNK